jgi:hypothetical protein
MLLLLTNYVAFFICDILTQVARTKSTARPMTSEELATAGISPTGEDTQSCMEDPTRCVACEPANREEGEIGSESISGGEEDLANVDADPS